MWITYKQCDTTWHRGEVVVALVAAYSIGAVIDYLNYLDILGEIDCKFKPRLRWETKDSGASPGQVTGHWQWWLDV